MMHVTCAHNKTFKEKLTYTVVLNINSLFILCYLTHRVILCYELLVQLTTTQNVF